MKALLLEEYNKLVYIDVPDPEVGEREVLIRVVACSICGSDVHGLDGSTGRRVPPLIMGHEASGEIAAVGARVTGWQIGQRVTFDSTIYCGTCWHCRRGEVNLCDKRRVLGVSCDEYRQHGAFAEYVAIPEHILYAISEEVSFEQASLVETLSIAVHAVGRLPIQLNDAALVVGTGNIGLLAIQVLKVFGCSPVIAADINEHKLSFAPKAGADIVVNTADTDLRNEVLKHTERGVDVAVEAVGFSTSIQSAVSALRKGGALSLIGNVSTTIDLPLQAVVTRQIDVRGSCASSGEYPVCMDLITRKAVDVDLLISAVVPLSEGDLWFQRLYQREIGLMKVVLKP